MSSADGISATLKNRQHRVRHRRSLWPRWHVTIHSTTRAWIVFHYIGLNMTNVVAARRPGRNRRTKAGLRKSASQRRCAKRLPRSSTFVYLPTYSSFCLPSQTCSPLWHSSYRMCSCQTVVLASDSTQTNHRGWSLRSEFPTPSDELRLDSLETWNAWIAWYFATRCESSAAFILWSAFFSGLSHCRYALRSPTAF